MKNQPTSIFLNLGFKPDKDTDFNDLSEITWITDCNPSEGLEYVSKESVRDEIDGYKSALGDLRAEKALIESLNETIDVELTDCGAKHLNKYHKELSEKFKTVTWKYDYKECDIYKDQAYSIFSVFEPFFHAGASMPFINLRKSK